MEVGSCFPVLTGCEGGIYYRDGISTSSHPWVQFRFRLIYRGYLDDMVRINMVHDMKNGRSGFVRVR